LRGWLAYIRISVASDRAEAQAEEPEGVGGVVSLYSNSSGEGDRSEAEEQSQNHREPFFKSIRALAHSLLYLYSGNA
jgi:hypothetical protein